CGPLCDAVTGDKTGQAMLEQLERANLFLVSLDDSREWFRYHQLFADFLQAELRQHYPDLLIQFHRRAALWYLAHDLPEPAFQHAVAGEDPALVMQIGEHYFDIKLLSGEYTVLKRWLGSLPPHWHDHYPQLGLIQAVVLLFT